MELVHVKGNTYYIDAWEAIPVYVKENRDCILLDSGWHYERFDVEQTLLENNLRPVGIIGTHLHTDHVGGHQFLREKYKIPVALPTGEAGLGFNDLTLKSYLYIFTLEDVRTIDEIKAMRFTPDVLIGPEDTEIEMAGVRFGIVHTPGHSPDHVSIMTPDEVLYLGDAMLSKDVMAVSKVPYYASVDLALQSMEKLAGLSCMALAAHKGVDPDIKALAEYNIQQILEHAERFHALVTEPMTLEDIIKKACSEMKLLSKQAFKVKLYERDIRSYIEYLADRGALEAVCEGGRLYWVPCTFTKMLR